MRLNLKEATHCTWSVQLCKITAKCQATLNMTLANRKSNTGSIILFTGKRQVVQMYNVDPLGGPIEVSKYQNIPNTCLKC